jgi:tetratricopeptide (TPR) repeat protein
MFLLVNYRPEYQPPWGSRTSYTQLRLDPLGPDDAEALLGALLGADATLQPLKRVLITRTEGNPFFLEESVRALVETGALGGDRGAYRLARPLPNIQVPATVQAVLAARIDRLRPEDKTLLQTASVIGKDVPLALLRAMVELAEGELHAAIGRLQGAEFLYETSLFPDPEYTFKHALTHDVAYSSLLQDRRRALHGRIVATIERLYPDRLTEHVERLAHHAVRGDLWEKAVTYLRQAGAKALARSANREAVAYLEQALTALSHLPETRETQEHAIDVRFDLRGALFALAEFGSIYKYLQEAETLARGLDDQRRLGWVLAHMTSNHLGARASITEARSCAEQVQAIGETLADVPLQVAAQYYHAHLGYMSGDYRGTEGTCRRLMQLMQGERADERFSLWQFPAVLSRTILARTLAERGLFDEGETHGHDAIRIAEGLDHQYSLIEACLGLGYLYSIKGDLSRAVRPLERAVALGGEDITLFVPNAMASLGHVDVGLGRVKEGLPWLQQALAGHDSAGIGYFHAVSLVQAGEAYLLAGQVDDASVCADRALTLTRERGERGHEAWALRLLGEIAAHADPPDAESGQAHYSQALARAEELGMRPLASHCHFGLGKFYRCIGKREQAQERLAAATTMYREMGMVFWLEKAEAASAEVG